MCLQENATTTAVNLTEVPKRHSEARIDEFSIDVQSEDGQQMFIVTGEAIDRFAQMTNWDYYEAANRFQKVLEAAGETLAISDEVPRFRLSALAVLHLDQGVSRLCNPGDTAEIAVEACSCQLCLLAAVWLVRLRFIGMQALTRR